MLHLFTLFFSILSVHGLSPFLTHYEPLNYHTSDLARVSRSAQPHDTVRLEFDAFNRTFKLHLRKISPEESMFLEDATIEFNNETMKVDRGANIYKGFLEDDNSSHVYGSMFEGIFSGVIETGDGKEYGVEYSIRHNSSAPFHSFIYDVIHIKMPNKTKTKRSEGSFEDESMCGLSDPKIAENLKLEKTSSPSSVPSYSGRSIRQSSKDPKKPKDAKKDKDGIYENRLCTLNMHVDHMLYKHYIDGDDTNTKNRLTALIEKELQGVNRVYEKTNFGGILDITFKAKNVKIWTGDKNKDKAKYPYTDENLDVNSFLGINGMQNHSDYCLGYVMTYRDFAGGTLGLAFVGGVGSTYSSTASSQRSKNAGIVTYLNHGSPVLERLSYLTLAHEIGHNFDSPHDETDECKGGSEGQFIMWYAATSGDQPNNKKFSECSIKKMSAKLHIIMKIDPKDKTKHDHNPFIPSDSPMCGNGIVEKDEVCDCGRTQQDCDEIGDKCCHPFDVDGKGCTLKTPNTCAPSQGRCCKEDCNFESPTFECEPVSECAEKAICSASVTATPKSAKCPKAAPANENSPCMDATGVCHEGLCNQTRMCLNMNMTECVPKEKTCMRHCMKDGECKPTSELAEFADDKFAQKGRWGHPGVMLRPMSQCLDGKGLCDQFDICKAVKPTGFMTKGFQMFKSFGETMIKKIWILIIVIIVVLIVLIVVIKFCSYATPSSNPNKPKAKSMKQIKNMMSDRVKRMSSKRKPRKGKGKGTKTPDTTAKTPVNKKEKTKETNEDEE